MPFVHNGHTTQVNYPSGSTLTVAGCEYELIQFHFHHSSEHTVDGHFFDLELHLVHRDADGRLLVVTVFIEEGAADACL